MTKTEYFKDRFSNARKLEKPVGWNLPLGSIHRKNHGNGFMLLGDAAGLVDPFTGEGIGNAMVAGKYAIQVTAKCRETGDFSESALTQYDQLLWGKIGSELKTRNYRHPLQNPNDNTIIDCQRNESKKKKPLSVQEKCEF